MRVPKSGTIHGFCASSQASATCAGVALCLSPMLRSRSISAWLASRASGAKRGILLRKSLLCQRGAGVDLAGQEALAERAEGHEADAELFKRRDDLGFGFAGPQRVLALQRGHRLHRVGPTDRVGAGFGQAEVADLALGDEVLHGPGDVLHRHIGIDPVLVVEVDVVGPEPPEAALDGAPDLGRFAVDAAAVFAGLLVDVPAELGGDLHFVADAREGLAHHLLVGPGPVDFRRVEEVHAEIDRLPQQVDHLGAVLDLAGLAIAHGSQATALTPRALDRVCASASQSSS